MIPVTAVTAVNDDSVAFSARGRRPHDEPMRTDTLGPAHAHRVPSLVSGYTNASSGQRTGGGTHRRTLGPTPWPRRARSCAGPNRLPHARGTRAKRSALACGCSGDRPHAACGRRSTRHQISTGRGGVREGLAARIVPARRAAPQPQGLALAFSLETDDALRSPHVAVHNRRRRAPVRQSLAPLKRGNAR